MSRIEKALDILKKADADAMPAEDAGAQEVRRCLARYQTEVQMARTLLDAETRQDRMAEEG